MTRRQRVRSRLLTRDLAARLYEARIGVNRSSHHHVHRPKTLVYTSRAGLDTNPSSVPPVTFPGKIVGVRLSVQGAPSSDMECDLLINGISVFQGGDPMPVVLAGQTQSHKSVVTVAHFSADDLLQVQLPNMTDAVGPLIIFIDYYSEV